MTTPDGHDNFEKKKETEVTKSENDKREYKYLVLSNKLKLLLISDPNSEKSAASANIHVGHTSDPDSVPGIAHFCEHMLFLGTEKYPHEGEYGKFIAQHGGRKNASTSVQFTNYYFDVKSEALFEVLDRFAQFFICPLFNVDATDREVHAIDSEHQKNVLNDHRRKYYINKATARPGHVYQKFGTGNIETLKTVPEKENINIRELLLDFHNKYYSANIMTVVVLGRETITQLEKVIVPLFEDVKNKDVVISPCDQYPYGNDELGIIIKIPTIKEIKKLVLKFTMPDLLEHYKSNPSKYISRLIGHEGKGSLLSLLKKKLWVNELNSGSYRVLKGFEFFDITMDLTDEGLNQIFEIITIFFQYISMLKQEGPQRWLYDEMKTLEEIKFRFKDKEQPIDYVRSLSTAMQLYPQEDVLYGAYCLDSFQPNLIRDVLNNLNPMNFRCTVQSQIFEGKTDRIYKYYTAGYSIEQIPEEHIKKWVDIGPHPELHLPNKNLFIPDSLEVVVPKEEKEIPNVPMLVKDNDMIRVWYKADDTFFLPKAILKLHISSPIACVSPSNVNHLKMYVRLLRDEMVEYGYDALKAGITYNIYSTSCGFSIEISGYNNKQLLLLRKILEYIIKLDIKKDRFDVNKVQYEENLKNVELEEPYMQIDAVQSYLISENSWRAEDKLEHLGSLSIDSLKYFIPELLKSIYVECLFCGNLLIHDVKEICTIVESMLIGERTVIPLLPTQHLLRREHKLSKHVDYLYEKQSKIHSNSCIKVYMQVGLQEKHAKLLCELFSHISSAQFYDMLRTKEQLGYIVNTRVSKSISVIGIRALIQSSKSPTVVYEKIETFFELFDETLKSLSDEQFRDYVEGLAVKKLEKPKRMGIEAWQFWNEIMIKQYNFRRGELEVEELRKITKEDVVQFYKKHISPASEDRKKLAVVVLGKDATGLTEGNKSWHVINDVLTFKTGLPLYPHILPYNDVPLLSTIKFKL